MNNRSQLPSAFNFSSARTSKVTAAMRIRSASTVAVAVILSFLVCAETAAADKAPKLDMQYFFGMPRAWVEVVKADPERQLLQVRTKSGELREVEIRPETTLRVRDSFGDLSDYYPGEWVMLFMYHDAQRNWVFPRAVQDELQMMSSHGWKWTVDSLDRKQGRVELSRQEQVKGNADAKTFHESFRVSDLTRVWKGEQDAGLETLEVGDVVLFQTRKDSGQELRFVVEFFDAQGLIAVKAAQHARYLARLHQTGMPTVVNDLDVLRGTLQLSILPQGAQAAKDIKAGDRLTIEPAAESGEVFTATVIESRPVRKERKLQLTAASTDFVRLQIGNHIRVRVLDKDQSEQ